jgi:hypothetical protein
MSGQDGALTVVPGLRPLDEQLSWLAEVAAAVR